MLSIFYKLGKIFRHSITVRYGEVDQQGVAFNAHYLAYMDDAMDTWIRQFPDLRQRFNWDMMNKKCCIEWLGPITSGDILDIDVAVIHWGRTSWTLGFVGTCKGQPVFRGQVIYISVRLGKNTIIETPPDIKEALGQAMDKNFACMDN